MNLTRDNFEPETLAVLDHVALLLYINNQLRRASKTFENSPELDRKHATPSATGILNFTRVISGQLLDALYLKSDVRNAQLATAYENARAGICEAIENAKILSDQEIRAEAGNVVQVAVLKNLENLKSAWDLAR